MKFKFTIVLCVLYFRVFGQFNITGKVVDAQTGLPIPFASVYMNNSSIGATSNNNGEFAINGIAVNRFDLICSSVGYDTYNEQFVFNAKNINIKINLAKKVKTLDAVIIQPFENNGWQKWSKVFLDNLFGNIDHATFCTIKNPQVIKFRFNKKQNVLTAISEEPIIIINKYLGYELQFDLQLFDINFNEKSTLFAGFPFFKKLKGNLRKQEKWRKHKQETYEGSVMHFMRSVYRNQLKQDSFEVRVLKRFANFEKKRVKLLLQENIKNNRIILGDSTVYFSKILKQSDSLDYTYPNEILADSFAYKIDSVTVGIYFSNQLAIKYLKPKKVMVTTTFHGNTFFKQQPISIISLLNTNEIVLLADGSYFNPLNLFFEGYWGHSEKLSSLLPVDYVFEE